MEKNLFKLKAINKLTLTLFYTICVCMHNQNIMFEKMVFYLFYIVLAKERPI